MASAPAAPTSLSLPPRSDRASFRDQSVWQAPLFPAALAVTAGIVLDRYLSIPLVFSLLTGVASLVAWGCAQMGRQKGLPLVYLALAGAALGAGLSHYRREVYAADDVGELAPAEPRPVQIRGILEDEPHVNPALQDDPLRTRDRTESATTVLRARQIRLRTDWLPVSGKVRLVVPGTMPELHAGDEVEVVGLLARVRGPANPGEWDFAASMRDRGIRSEVIVRKTPDGVVRLERGWPTSFTGLLAVVRGWGQNVLQHQLPRRSAGVAMALLLGEGSTMTSADWEKYQRTAVIHVLAISGQHLVVLGAVLWWLLRRLGVRQRRGALVVALFLLGYALLTGGQPPALRSAVMVCAACVGLVLRRRVLAANSFALAWLLIALLDPADLFAAGCQLSFLSVAVLYWGTGRWLRREEDPLERLIEESRPVWQRCLRGLGRGVLEAYLVGLVIWLLVAPLVAFRYHLLGPVGILLGPPLTLLAAVALVAGFLLLLFAAILPPLATLFVPFVHGSLAICEFLVDLGDSLPGGHFYVGDVPEWWLWVFYGGLFAVLTQEGLRRRWPWGVAGGLGWLSVGLLAGAVRLPSDELRCTFLAVGHGGCTVLETPDGRTLLYDAGALAGPDVTRRQIAPFLWHRGIRRIDEIFLSHADLDHFNGLPALLPRFAIGQVTLTPTFADKPTAGVEHTLQVLRKQGIPVRIVKAGDRLTAGAVEMEVLHPPAVGPDGNENARSLVLRIQHAGHVLLLTGDLEGPGLERVLTLPRHKTDVLMAPHHGSVRANTEGLAKWARPRLVVSCQGPPLGAGGVEKPYTRIGANFLSTWTSGAVTVRSHRSGLVIETYLTGERIALPTEGRGE
jgi:competence protein ComEC